MAFRSGNASNNSAKGSPIGRSLFNQGRKPPGTTATKANVGAVRSNSFNPSTPKGSKNRPHAVATTGPQPKGITSGKSGGAPRNTEGRGKK